ADLVYTVELRDAANNAVVANNDVTVTTELGVITIAAGSSSGTLSVPVQGDDVYIDHEIVTNAITAIVEANAGDEDAFEDLVFDGTSVTTQVNDTIDTVTAYLSVALHDVEAVSADLVYTVELRDAANNAVVANNDVTVTTDLGVITIAAGSSSGTLNVPVQGDDVYIDTETVTNQITAIVEAGSGAQGAFENLEFDATQVNTTVKDTLDPVTVKLKVSETAVDEGAVDNLVYTVYLEDADGNAVTASND